MSGYHPGFPDYYEEKNVSCIFITEKHREFTNYLILKLNFQCPPVPSVVTLGRAK